MGEAQDGVWHHKTLPSLLSAEKRPSDGAKFSIFAPPSSERDVDCLPPRRNHFCMKPNFGLLLALVFVEPTWAADDPKPSSAELAKAIRESEGRIIAAKDIRVLRCNGPKEEPTEFECTWLQRSNGHLKLQKTWFAIDRDGWHDID